MAAPRVPQATYFPRHLGATIDHPQFRRDQARYNRELAADRLFPILDHVDEEHRAYVEFHGRAQLKHIRNLIIKHELRPGTPEELRRGRKHDDGDEVTRPDPVHLSSLPRRVYEWMRWNFRGSSIGYMAGEESLRYESSEGSSGSLGRRGWSGSRRPVFDLEAQVGVEERRPRSSASLRTELEVSDSGSDVFVSCPSSPQLEAASATTAVAVVAAEPLPAAALTPPAVLLAPSIEGAVSTRAPGEVAAAAAAAAAATGATSAGTVTPATAAAATPTAAGPVGLPVPAAGHDDDDAAAPPKSTRLTSRALRFMRWRTWLGDAGRRVGRSVRAVVAERLTGANLARQLVWRPARAAFVVAREVREMLQARLRRRDDSPWYRIGFVDRITGSASFGTFCVPASHACFVGCIECCLNNPCWEACGCGCCPG